MKKLNINRVQFSKLFWTEILKNSENFYHEGWVELRGELNNLDSKRAEADYNTGSISQGSAFCLYSLVNYFKPKTIAEVGTFIGKSTLAMAKALDQNKEMSIHTCDFSNSINLNLKTDIDIVQYKKQSSTQMFAELNKNSVKVDMFFLDGRVTQSDVAMLSEISSEKFIVALDDFIGIEKGVMNTIKLSGVELMKNHILIYPPEMDVLKNYGFFNECTTACFIPFSLLKFTSQ